MMAQKSDRETSLRAEYDVFFSGCVEGVSYISMLLRCSGFLIPRILSHHGWFGKEAPAGNMEVASGKHNFSRTSDYLLPCWIVTSWKL